MKITPFGNGVHSIASGLRHLEDYLSDSEDHYKLKDAITAIHHGIEALLKDVIFSHNPAFIFSDATTIKKIVDYYKKFYKYENYYLFDDALTISSMEALTRVQELELGDISQREYKELQESYQKLNTLRNQIQHFAISADPQAVIRIMGELVPKFIQYIETCYARPKDRADYVSHRPSLAMGHLFKSADFQAELARFNPNAPAFVNQLRLTYDQLLRKAIESFQGTIAENALQKVSLESRGKVGAPPYYPDIELKGWLNISLVSYKNGRDDIPYYSDGNTYTGEITIEDIIEKRLDEWHSELSQSLSLTFEINVGNLSEVIQLEEYQEYLQFLRNGVIVIAIDLHWTGTTIDAGEGPFGLSKFSELSGNVTIELNAGFFGEPTNGRSVKLTQSFPLSENSTDLDVHAFSKFQPQIEKMFGLKLFTQGDTIISCQKM